MAAPNANAEPSMEEILASIRRIISEDEQQAAPPPRPAPPPEPLTLNRPAEPAWGGNGAARAEVADDLMVFEDERPPLRPAPPPQQPAPAHAAAPPPLAEGDDALLSEPTAAAAAGAFTRLAGSVRVAETYGQTLEGLVRELLRPMLKEWLEANLPRLVEEKVEAELARIRGQMR